MHPLVDLYLDLKQKKLLPPGSLCTERQLAAHLLTTPVALISSSWFLQDTAFYPGSVHGGITRPRQCSKQKL